MANKPITRSQKLRSFVAPLLDASYGQQLYSKIMNNELLFINLTETIAIVSILIGCNAVFFSSMIRQKLSFGYVFFAFYILKGFNKREWLLLILFIIVGAIFATVSGNAHNAFLDKYGTKPDTWFI
jgi:hypothetical protein